jgi:acid phosphatase family membrane protein YuiD
MAERGISRIAFLRIRSSLRPESSAQAVKVNGIGSVYAGLGIDKSPALIDCYSMPFSVAKFIDSFVDFFANDIVLSSLASWFFSQLIKGVIVFFKIRKKGIKELLATFFWRTGGMPSSHSAVVASMTAAVGFIEGLGSNLFAVSLLIAMVVMRDAVGVRRAVGLHARSFNLLGRYAADKFDYDFHPVKEIQGHGPLEVAAGALLGIIVSAFVVFL